MPAWSPEIATIAERVSQEAQARLAQEEASATVLSWALRTFFARLLPVLLEQQAPWHRGPRA